MVILLLVCLHYYLNDKYRYCCLKYNLELPQYLHSTYMTNTHNLPQFSLENHPIHPGSLAFRLRAAYDTLMAAGIVAGIVSLNEPAII